MVSLFRSDTAEENSLQILWEDGAHVLCRGWRLQANGRRVPVLAKLATENLTPTAVERLSHEYELKDELDGGWAVLPLALQRDHGRSVLVLEDPGGELLDGLLGQPIPLGLLLRLAIGIAESVAKLHARGFIHKDIKPAHLLVDTATGAVRLTGFGIASRLPRERPAADPPEVIAGTLAYMAPEQTGRMNRSVDSRSDLYSVGVVLYQMLTGSLPFSATEPMEWVHCHIARRPPPPEERLPGASSALSAIVLKLLAKTAEERYRTAAGLTADLKHCLAEWERNANILSFALGTQDFPDQLRIPERLYGREREVSQLLAAFERVVTGGGPELVLVSGYSGIGKSAVVNELHKALAPSRGLFASGKFDQYKRDIPYATLVQALRGLTQALLVKSDAELSHWRDALREALGPNGRLMIDLVSELKLIIGEQPPVPELPPQQSQGRFQLTFRRFLGVFARHEHPLALFLDDLQWLDAATLDLFEELLTQPDIGHLLLIGAYRDNEVDAAHPLLRKLESLREAKASVEEIRLQALGQDDLRQLVADALNCEPEKAAPLAKLVHEKTAGNPFFAIQFLLALAEEGLLAFEHDAGRWRWDLNRIHHKGYADNVADLMVAKLTRLPVPALNALKLLACLGIGAEIATLSFVSGVSEQTLQTNLWEAVRQELILYWDGAYRFIHDRVQEAAYSLVPEDQRAAAHLRIGRLLLAQTPIERREEAIFGIVNQLNRGAALIDAGEERERLAELNLIAGRRARASTAYTSALNYLAAGAELLAEDSWQRRHELIFGLELNRAECEFLIGAAAKAEARLTALSERAETTMERAAVACLRIDLYLTLDRSASCIAVGLDYLRHLGLDWPTQPTDEAARGEYERVRSQLAKQEIEKAVELPLMTDPEALATLDVLVKLVIPAYFTNLNLTTLAVCRAVDLSLERGNSDASCTAYACLSTIAGRFGDYEAAKRFGQIGYDLVEVRGLKRFQARLYLDFASLLWMRHVSAGRDLARRAFEIANNSGDTYAAHACWLTITNRIAAGDPLSDVQREAEAGLAFAQKLRFGFVIGIMTAQLGLIRTLRGLTPTFGSIDDSRFDDIRIERPFSTNPNLARVECWYWIRTLQARFFAGDWADAIEASLRAQPLLWTSVSNFEAAEYHFYSALSQAASDDLHPSRLQPLTASYEQLAVWAQHCPENFEDRVALIGAEIARIEGRDREAMDLYERAIRAARAGSFVHNEGLAHELAARFYAEHGFEDIAHLYLRKARSCYLRWGAEGKVSQLDRLYPRLKTEELALGPTSTIGAPVEHLDLATVIKVSQAVAGEIVLDKLIETLMRTAVTLAGAERGLLVRSRNAEPRVEAEANSAGGTVLVRLQNEPAISDLLPESILQYVLHSNENVILDDAVADPQFAEDPYVRRRQARSVLCLPLINQARLIGLLYLENNLAPRVFAPARITALKLLASQAAISLENSRLFRDLEKREAQNRRLVEANIIGIFIWSRDGRILEANDEFLRMVGSDRDDLSSGRISWIELTPQEWRDQDDQLMREYGAGEKIPPFEKEYFRKDGSRVPILIGFASFEAGGDQGVAFVVDLTDRKRTEEALRRNEAFLAEAQRLSQTGSWTLDTTTRSFTHWSLQQYRLYGLNPEDGLPSFGEINSRVHPDDLPGCVETLDRAIRDRTRYELDYRVIQPDGAVKHIHSVANPVFSAAGEIVEIVGTNVDVTERKQTEQERRESDRRYREAQAQLAHANRLETMGQLTASIAHEVNQPIAATLSNAQAALRWLDRPAPDLEEAKQGLARIVRDATRAGAVVQRIRNLINKAPTREDRVDINAVVREVIELSQREALKNGVTVQTELVQGLPLIQGDRVQLQQVILNLIVNSVEATSAMSEGPRELMIMTSKTDSSDILVSVRDSGPGLVPDALNHIFDAFYTTKTGGLGMGLSICRSIVELHGGRLWASGNTPRGAVFQFTLPFVLDKEIKPSLTH